MAKNGLNQNSSYKKLLNDIQKTYSNNQQLAINESHKK